MHWITDIDRRLRGWPNEALTIALLLMAGLLVVVALRGSPSLKAFFVAYSYLP